jgi:hypothetical protein
MFRPLPVIARLVAISTVVVLTASCADDQKATPQVIFDGRIQNGTGNDCQDEGSLFKIGDFGNQNSEPKVASTAIRDGQAWEQGTVSVSCTVTPAGADEFNVAASVDLSKATGGFMRIDGKFKTSGEQTGIHAIFSSRRTLNTYEQLDRQCTVTYPQFGGVASGRVWGEIKCPKAENVGAQKACEGIAEFRFENCAQ